MVGVRNVEEGSVYVSVSKSEPDVMINGKRRFGISSKLSFQCEPSGEFVLELMKGSNTLGTASISLDQILADPASNLTLEKWVDLVPTSKAEESESKPLGLRVAISLTIPTAAPYPLSNEEEVDVNEETALISVGCGNRPRTGGCFGKKQHLLG